MSAQMYINGQADSGCLPSSLGSREARTGHCANDAFSDGTGSNIRSAFGWRTTVDPRRFHRQMEWCNSFGCSPVRHRKTTPSIPSPLRLPAVRRLWSSMPGKIHRTGVWTNVSVTPVGTVVPTISSIVELPPSGDLGVGMTVTYTVGMSEAATASVLRPEPRL